MVDEAAPLAPTVAGQLVMVLALLVGWQSLQLSCAVVLVCRRPRR